MPSEPPRFVPTLTEVVEAGAPFDDTTAPGPAAVAPHARASRISPASSINTIAPTSSGDARLQDDLAEQIAHRVLQRVDAALEDRLTATIRTVVERHTVALLPTLREEIVAAVQDTVTRALAQELVAPSAPAPD